MRHRFLHILFALILVILCLPLLQHIFNFRKEWELGGDAVPAKDTVLTWDGWFDGSYQAHTEKYINDHVGFHHSFIRLRNQVAFTLFKKAKANGVIVGKENYIYELNYIDAYNGDDLLPEDTIRIRMEKTKMIADSLKRMGKDLFLVFCPGKGSFFPEYFPERYRKTPGITNIQRYLCYSDALQIPYINFHSWFLAQKHTSPYPLYSKVGIHWSIYGSALATDSIIRYIEKTRGIDMQQFRMDKVEMKRPTETDMDLEHGMNLLFKIKAEPMGYPVLQWDDDSGKIHPDVLVIADSYYWQIYGKGYTKAFGNTAFWYYNRQIMRPGDSEHPMVADVDIMQELQKYQVIILLSTDANLPKFGWGFMDAVYERMYPGRPLR